MNNLRSTYTNYIVFPSLALFVFSLPFPIAYNSTLMLIIFTIFLLDMRNYYTNVSSYFKNQRNILLLLIFLALLISTYYSDDKIRAFKGVLSALPLLSLPLSLTLINKLSSKQIKILKGAFILGCLIASAIYLALALWKNGLIDGSYRSKASSGSLLTYLVNHLTYHHLSPSIHAIFFSLYISLAIFLLIFEFQHTTVFAKICSALTLFYFFIYLFLLTSATINFALYSFLLSFVFTKLSFNKWIHYVQFFGYIIVSTLLTGYLFVIKFIGPYVGDWIYRFDSDSINKNFLLVFLSIILFAIIAIFLKIFWRKSSYWMIVSLGLLLVIGALIYFKTDGDNINRRDKLPNNVIVRVNYGEEALRIIKENPVFGVGIGDKKINLIPRDTSLGIKRYAEFGEGTKPEDAFNPHNQFLDFWIAAGILPVVCFFIFLATEFRKAVHFKHIVYLGLLFCFTIFCLTDVAMMVQRGQIFFLFFICLFELEGKRKMEMGKESWE